MKQWTDATTERHAMDAFAWRKLNYRRTYDRALAGLIMAFERETSLCMGLPRCRPVAWGTKKRSKTLGIEIKHHKRCLPQLTLLTRKEPTK